MKITINIYYSGENGSARKFVDEMIKRSIVQNIRAEKGNKRYEYFYPAEDNETVLLINSWENQAAIDAHHASPMMKEIADLREKYDLHMKVERYVSEDDNPSDEKYIKK